MGNQFEEVEHTADVAIRIWGHDLATLFANAAHGMAYLLIDAQDVALTVREEIELEAQDVEILLVDWLSELLFLGERDNLVFTTIERLQVTPSRLRATVLGGAIQERHSYIKAVTFSELQITLTEKGYETVIVFDV